MSELNISEDAQTGISQSPSNEPKSGSSSQAVESSVFPDEDEETITMLDVIEREDKLEEEASAVLGFSDEKNCTYPKGYISRQALYSCATCSEGTDSQAAICLACSLECHENHELFELYTKRNYRCDCGNSKFKPSFECKFTEKQAKKAPLNENNKYNHNFSGRYCVCDKRYPPDEHDDSAEANDEMWQCIVCEDWYHTKHLEAIELPSKFDELMCGWCADKLEFIRYYQNIDKKISAETSPKYIATDASSDSLAKPISAQENTKIQTQSDSAKPQDMNEVDVTRTVVESPDQKFDSKESNGVDEQQDRVPCESDTNDSQTENKDPTTITKVTNTCFLDKLKEKFAELSVKHETKNEHSDKTATASVEHKFKGPIFWQDCAWRSMLCRCPSCLELYKEKDCEYLIDDRDTIQYYEAQGKAMAKNRESPYERGMSALNRMNRAAVVEALHGYDELKADLSSYLRKFADTKKVVREEDIHDFFAQLKTKKRQRLEYE